MKAPRSFSLLTFLLIATVAAIGAALYRANYEVHQKRLLFEKYSEEMGFMDIEDDSKLHLRRLGGYPNLSFAYRYQLPAKQRYRLRVGSGVVDPQTGFPPHLTSFDISNDESQGTLVVNLVKMPTNLGTRWTVEGIFDGQRRSHVCKEFEFTWLQTYLEAFPTERTTASSTSFYQHEATATLGHSEVLALDPTETHVLFEKAEFHPSAVPSLTPELLRNRKTFMIWIEPILPRSTKRGSSKKVGTN